MTQPWRAETLGRREFESATLVQNIPQPVTLSVPEQQCWIGHCSTSLNEWFGAFRTDQSLLNTCEIATEFQLEKGFQARFGHTCKKIRLTLTKQHRRCLVYRKSNCWWVIILENWWWSKVEKNCNHARKHRANLGSFHQEHCNPDLWLKDLQICNFQCWWGLVYKSTLVLKKAIFDTNKNKDNDSNSTLVVPHAYTPAIVGAISHPNGTLLLSLETNKSTMVKVLWEACAGFAKLAMLKFR